MQQYLTDPFTETLILYQPETLYLNPGTLRGWRAWKALAKAVKTWKAPVEISFVTEDLVMNIYKEKIGIYLKICTIKNRVQGTEIH